MTNKKTIEGIRLIARNTQKMKVFDKIAYSFGNSAVHDLLNEARSYEDNYMKEFDIYEKACIDYGKIDTDALRKQAEEIAEQNDDDESEVFYELFNKAVENVNPPHSKIMECITDEIGYYHEVRLYDGDEWFNDLEINVIDYDDGEKGTFTIYEDEE